MHSPIQFITMCVRIKPKTYKLIPRSQKVKLRVQIDTYTVCINSFIRIVSYIQLIEYIQISTCNGNFNDIPAIYLSL